jgi:hypothetical protein
MCLGASNEECPPTALVPSGQEALTGKIISQPENITTKTLQEAMEGLKRVDDLKSSGISSHGLKSEKHPTTTTTTARHKRHRLMQKRVDIATVILTSESEVEVPKIQKSAEIKVYAVSAPP